MKNHGLEEQWRWCKSWASWLFEGLEKMSLNLEESGRIFEHAEIIYRASARALGWFRQTKLGSKWRKHKEKWAISWLDSNWANGLRWGGPKQEIAHIQEPPAQPTRTRLRGPRRVCRGNFGNFSFVLYREGWCASFAHFFTSEKEPFFSGDLRSWSSRTLEETFHFHSLILLYVWYF